MIMLSRLAAPLLLLVIGANTPAPTNEVRAIGGRFALFASTGERLADDRLIGASFTLADRHGGRQQVRIDAVVPDPRSPGGDVRLYRLSARLPSGGWIPFCSPDAEGVAMGFPIAASDEATGTRRFALSCTSGAVGKCVRMGYRPWGRAADGTPLLEHHRACVRMLRADYCGDGGSHTRDGTRVDVYDRLGLQVPANVPGMRFEAAWSADGATCVARTRVATLATLEALARRCPARLGARLGPEACTADAPGALLFNRSTPGPGER
jgi:hypothetical protein